MSCLWLLLEEVPGATLEATMQYLHPCRCVHFGRPCYNDVMACSRSVLSHLEAYSAGKSCGLVQDAVLMRCPATDVKGLGDAHGGEKGEHIACKLH